MVSVLSRMMNTSVVGEYGRASHRHVIQFGKGNFMKKLSGLLSLAVRSQPHYFLLPVWRAREETKRLRRSR